MEKKDDTGAEIIYHFKVDQHRIPLTLSIETEQATKAILDDFNSQFFGGKLEYTLHVEPSEEGGYIRTIILGTTVGIFTVVAGDMTRSFIKGLTNNYHLDLSEEAGKKIGQYLNLIDDVTDDAVETDKTGELSKEIEGEIISLIPLHLLSENIQNLEEAGITSYKFCKTFKARNKFYNACIESEEVQGLSFNRSDNFLIKKDDFKNFIVDMPDESSQLFFETTVVAVNSPNWENVKKRKWQGKDSENRHIMFVIKDEVFWQEVHNNKINPTIKDSMQVQWIYQMKDGKRKDIEVIKVISFNDDPISKPLPDKEVQNKYKAEKKSLDGEPDLFVVQTDEDKNNSSND